VFKVKYDGKEIPCDSQNRFYPDMSNLNKNITVEAKLISPPMYIYMNYVKWHQATYITTSFSLFFA